MAERRVSMPDRLLIDAIPIEVRPSKRRRTRIGLAFDPAGFVIMETPPGTQERDVRSVVARHGHWLRTRLQAVQSETAPTASLRYASGDRIYLSGRSYALEVLEGDRDAVSLRPQYRDAQAREPSDGHIAAQLELPLFPPDDGGGALVVTLGPERAGASRPRRARVAALLRTWLVAQATTLFAAELNDLSGRLPWLAGRIPPWRHRFMRSQWGSCSQSGRIALNTHLVKLPRALVRYVVLHELCHLVEHNHGPRFYDLMAHHMPDWRVRRGELDRYLPVLNQD